MLPSTSSFEAEIKKALGNQDTLLKSEKRGGKHRATMRADCAVDLFTRSQRLAIGGW